MARHEVITGGLEFDALFSPSSIAIVGATESFDKVGGRVLNSLQFNGFAGPIYPINPGRDQVQGLKSYPSLAATGTVPDLVIVCLPAGDVEAQVESACELGVRAFIVYASGFAELGPEGAASQARLAAIVERYGALLIGPNCLGVVNGKGRMMASSTVIMRNRLLEPGRVSFVSQSGAVATFWLDQAIRTAVGVGKWVSTGNEAAVGLSDVLAYLVEDADTDIICLYVEGFREGAKLRAALARAARLRKPVIVVKAGRSQAGAEATASHTGALAGEDAVSSRLLEQYGVCQVGSLTEMNDLCRVLLSQRPQTGRRACIVSLSGGAGALLADACERHDIALPPLSETLAAKLKPFFPDYIHIRNPVDLTDRIIPHPEMFGATVEAVMASGEYDIVLGFMAGRAERLIQVATDDSIRLFPSWTGGYANVWQATLPETRARLEAGGVHYFDEIPQAVDALASTIAMAEVWAAPPAENAPPARHPDPAATLTEYDSKAMLRARAGLVTPDNALLSPEAVKADAADLPFAGPYAVKLQSTALLHKSGHGGIEIGLHTTAEVLAAAKAMVALAEQREWPCQGVLVEQMAGIEQEFLVGLRHDPVLGPFLVVGRGGVSVEVDPDVAYGFLPLSPADIAAMFRRLRCRKLLDGFRGRPAVPLDELAATIARLCELFTADPAMAEIELNPLCVCKDASIVAIDAAVTKSTETMDALP